MDVCISILLTTTIRHCFQLVMSMFKYFLLTMNIRHCFLLTMRRCQCFLFIMSMRSCFLNRHHCFVSTKTLGAITTAELTRASRYLWWWQQVASFLVQAQSCAFMSIVYFYLSNATFKRYKRLIRVPKQNLIILKQKNNFSPFYAISYYVIAIYLRP